MVRGAVAGLAAATGKPAPGHEERGPEERELTPEDMSVAQMLALRELAAWWRQQARNTPRHSRAGWRRTCPGATDVAFSLVRQPAFEKVFVWLILANTVMMATEFHSLGSLRMSDTHRQANQYANLVFVVAFGLEVLLKIVGLGLDEFSRDRFNIFDFFVTAGSVVELVLEPILEAQGTQSGAVQLSAL